MIKKNNDYFAINKENLEILNGYFRASNYLSVAQLYLKNNPLLRRPLIKDDIKSKLVGHWGTVPGQNFIYTHLNRAICKYDLNAILISGPGHGGNFFVSNSYLEGRYSEVYPKVSQDEQGMINLCKQFSFPCGISSHVAPQLPGSIHEGGELGYSLSHAFGTVLDNPNLLCACIIGDGEAETGPLATSWHGNKFINPITDGAVLPILHLNGYKINNPTILSRISKKELTDLMKGYGYNPYFVEGDDCMQMHKKMAQTMDKVIEDIIKIQNYARKTKDTTRPIWPMIVLRTPKGWTGPKEVDGKQIEGTFRAHQVPLQIDSEENKQMLIKWLQSYKPNELFDENYKLKDKYKKYIPKGNRRISANPHTNAGEVSKDLVLPQCKNYGVSFTGHGTIKTQDMLELGAYIRDIFTLNKESKNFRYFSPDEAMSNRLYKTFDIENRSFVAERLKNDDKLSPFGRIMDSYLSEHMCEGMLEGYLLTGRYGFFVSYEAFTRIVDSMVSQHIKWLKECQRISFRQDIPSLNIILTSHVWQQDHNGFTHQDPGFLDHLANKQSDIAHIYLPPDANTLIASFDECIRTKNQVNAIVASKHPSFQWLNMEEAINHVKKGIGIWEWASTNKGKDPDIVLACCGDTAVIETLATVMILREKLPELKIRVVNVVNLMTLEQEENHSCGLTDKDFDDIFTKDKHVIFCFHGYPKLIHELTYKRHNQNIHVHGYRENGSITTSFDMRVLNQVDRFSLVKAVVKRLPMLLDYGKEIIEEMDNKIKEHKAYIAEHGVDMPEIVDWKWIEN